MDLRKFLRSWRTKQKLQSGTKRPQPPDGIRGKRDGKEPTERRPALFFEEARALDPNRVFGGSKHGVRTNGYIREPMFKRLQNLLSPGNLAILASVALLYCLAGKLGLRVAFVHPYITPIWISSGIAVAAFILFGHRVWPAISIGGFVDHVTTDGLLLATFTISAMATLEGLAAASPSTNLLAARKRSIRREACSCSYFSLASALLDQRHFGAAWSISAEVFLNRPGYQIAHVLSGIGVGTLLVAPFLILLFRAPHHRLDLRRSESWRFYCWAWLLSACWCSVLFPSR